MHRPHKIVCSSVALFFGLMAVAVIAPAYANWLVTPPPSAVIAFVDLEKVFNDIKQRAEAEVALEQRAQQLTDQAEALRNEAELLKQDLDLLVAGTDQYENAEKKWTQAVLEYSALVEFSRNKLDALKAGARKEVFAMILDQMEVYAREHGIDFILADDSTLAMEGKTDIQIVQQLAMRRLLYANRDFDVTADLIEWINR